LVAAAAVESSTGGSGAVTSTGTAVVATVTSSPTGSGAERASGDAGAGAMGALMVVVMGVMVAL